MLGENIHKFVSRLSKRERIFFNLSIFFVSLAFLVRVVILPALAKIKSLDEEIESKKLILKKDLNYVSYRNRIHAEYVKLSSYFTEENSPDEEMNILQKIIVGFASQAAVNIVSIKPTYNSENKEKKFFIDLSYEGDMTKVVRFLYLIETAPKLFVVERLLISPVSESSSLANCRMTIAKLSTP